MFPAPSRVPRSGGSPLASGATIPLAFIGAGLLGSVAGTSWLALAPDVLALPHVHPVVIALAHVWLLGALLPICCGAVYQLLPVLANTAFTGARLAWTHLALHGAGAGLMIGGFSTGRMGWVALGGGAVTLGVFFFAANVARTLRAAPRLDPILATFGVATGWLLATVLAGLALALNLRFGGWSLDVLALLRVHAHLGVVGFFVTLLQGAMFRLVPMFTLAEVRDLRRIGLGLSLTPIGLLVLAPGLAWHQQALEVTGATLLLLSFVLSGIELRRVLGTRKKRHFEPGLQGFFAGLLFLLVAAGGGVGLGFHEGSLPAALAYGVVGVLGGLLLAVEGMLCKIVPFLVWMRVYGPRVGRQPTPVAAALGSPSAERAWVWLHATSVALLGLGTWREIPAVLTGGAVIFAVGQIALLTSLTKVAAHLWRPVVPLARAVKIPSPAPLSP